MYADFQNGIPVFHFLTEKYKVVNMVILLTAVREKVDTLRLTMGLPIWRPSCWLIDIDSKGFLLSGSFLHMLLPYSLIGLEANKLACIDV